MTILQSSHAKSTRTKVAAVRRICITWAVWISYSRNFGIRIDGNELRSELLVFPDINRVRIIVEAHFFERNAHLE